ncbi:FAD binding domain-containing protein [Arcticibacter eurypsychrophilus]|uniref:FAD binding domain-containing protein n=1 Tax=Arcticibacter eurypsychrophilus TaxID=1434752 RepID=UPI00084DEFC8|nr:xanthine dehydrogenase family protein subunit M [Arcticibacter eurypsychrophilus]
MRPFKYTHVNTVQSATQLVSTHSNAKFLAGGTNILDLMKEDVERPDELLDITFLKVADIKMITEGPNKGGVSLGALSNNTETANHELIRLNHPLLTQAILAGASAQIRNMATNGGNLMQRTRCPYFYDVDMPCNKRVPGSGCGAMEGINRMHAIFGWSSKCIAVYPSDMAVALAVLDATVQVANSKGQQRRIAFTDFHRLPGENPEKDNNLLPGELITAIELPPNKFASHSYYLKVRDRASYAFALVSVAAGLELNGNNIVQAKIALGGVAHKPWRALRAEELLKGKEATEANFQAAAEAEMNQAKPLEYNRFKVELGKRAIVRALDMAMNNGSK